MPSSDQKGDYMFLRPLQEVVRTLEFKPEEPKAYSIKMSCKTTRGFQSSLECNGSGVLPPLCFSSSLISFDVTAFGGKQSRVIQLQRSLLKYAASRTKDKAGVAWRFEFGQPLLLEMKSGLSDDKSANLIKAIDPASEEFVTAKQLEKIVDDVAAEPVDLDANFFDIWPSSGQMDYGMTNIGVQITVCPPTVPAQMEPPIRIPTDDLVESTDPNAMPFKSSKDRVKRAESLQQSAIVVSKAPPQPVQFPEIKVEPAPATNLTPLQKMLFATAEPELTWLLPCRITEGIANRIGYEDLSASSATTSRRQTSALPEFVSSESVIYLKMITPFSFPSFSIVQPKNTSINFGKVAVGQKQMGNVIVKNLSSNVLQLKCRGINASGPFYLSRAIRPIEPGQSYSINIGFTPEVDTVFLSTIEFYHGNTVRQVKIFGEGIVPSVELDLSSKEISFGNVVVGDQISKAFKLTNTSAIPIECVFSMPHTDGLKLCSASRYGTQNSSGRNPFSSSILRTIIAPGASSDVIVKFSPDKQSELFFDTLSITFAGQKNVTNVRLTGRAWGTTLCVIGYEPHPVSYLDTCCVGNNSSQLEASLLKLHGVKTLEEGDIDEESLSRLYLSMTNRRDTYFVTFEMKWIKVPASKLGYTETAPDLCYWRIESKVITLGNLKPFSLKLDAKKCDCDFTVEDYEGTFTYDDFLHDYAFKPAKSKSAEKHDLRFILDTKKGLIEYGSTKALKVTAIDPMRAFYDGCIQSWEKFDTSHPKGVPMIDLDRKRLGRKELVDPSTFFMPLPDKETSYYKKNMQEKELAEPVYVETVYKIKMKGGYRLIEPKGNQGENEAQTFFLKIRADPKNQ
jgi:Abnormal spindle-like microcephaly-assoc'd, ASPM-SPD-2-Hydin